MRSWLWDGICVGLMVGALGTAPAMAAEHGGKEHAGQEHGGQPVTAPAPAAAAPAATDTKATTTPPEPAASTAAPSAEQIREAIGKYVQETTQDEGAFYVDDEMTGETRELLLDHVHERVGKTGDYYYSCADMKDIKTGEVIDVDFDVESTDGQLEVVDVRIHKVAGKARYMYDANDNRIPVTP